MSRFAAFTIVSKNYLSLARVLAKSYIKHHPDHKFITVLVDELDSDYDGTNEPFDLVLMKDIPLPNADVFPYQYTILELNTAIKPFCLLHFLEAYDLSGLLYIDPDIMVFRKLVDIWEALDTHDVVLTPHMREPFCDDAGPSELSILQSGTYNLGFLGLRRGETSRKLLQWWSERLYADCVVDIPRGLFVDQKWMDLIPAYFQDVKILRNPAYNVAYWNLHERTLTQSEDGGFLVDGIPLGFFHFSGYNPTRPDRLSKHQTRHDLTALPVVRAVCDVYARELHDARFIDTARLKYAYGKLSNGVKVTRVINAVVLHCVRNRIAFPSPGKDPTGFCRFLMSPNAKVCGADIAPLVFGVRLVRPDVANAFPNSAHNKHDAGVLDWLYHSGAVEEQLELLMEKYGQLLTGEGAVSQAMAIYDRRSDLRSAFPNAFSSSAGYAEYAEWLRLHGTLEEGLDVSVSERFRNAEQGFARVLHAYFVRTDLQAAFPLLYKESSVLQLAGWFLNHLREFPQLTQDDVKVFERAALLRRNEVLLASLRYNPHVRDTIGGLPSALNAELIRGYLSSRDAESAWPFVMKTLLAGRWIAPIEQYHAFCFSNPRIGHMFPHRPASSREALKCAHFVLDRFGFKTPHSSWSSWAQQVLDRCQEPLRNGLNVFGYLKNTSGMGESGRSMVRTIKATSLAFTASTLPGMVRQEAAGLDIDPSLMYGQPDALMNTNIVVANADVISNVREWLPVHLLAAGTTNIGYWVWETEELPLRFDDSPRGLDAIWTASRYSAQAIRNVTDLPVHVVPHTLDFDALEQAIPRRADFGLPNDKILFGYFFDSNSVLERKNPGGVLEAFRSAFAGRDDVALVFKVNEPRPGNYDYERLKSAASDLDVIWIEASLDRADTFDLMKSLDVYVSLHRSEGFGLTMAEAMAMGIPVVATGYSGNVDFMDEDCSMLVDYEVVTTRRPYGPYPTGTRWAEPSIADAAMKLAALADPALRRKLGEKGYAAVRERLDTDAIAAVAQETLSGPQTSSTVVAMRGA